MVDHEFDGTGILSQLQCSGMTTVLELMQQVLTGYATFCYLWLHNFNIKNEIFLLHRPKSVSVMIQ